MLDILFSPFKLKGKTLKNRCVVPPMVSNFCNHDGTVTERFMAYHEAKAKGGFGMIITEDFSVDPRGKGFKDIPGFYNDAQVEGFREFTKRIHKYGTVLIAQIYHCGRQTSSAVIEGETPWAPSAIPCPFSPDMLHEMIIEEIRKTVSQYGDAARRAEQAGFDGIEIHGAHGYLIAQFLSPYSNKRTDEYGGDLVNRMRFALEIIKDIKSKVSDDFIVGFRISTDEFVTGGRTIEDTKAIVPYLEKAGVDYIHATAGVYRSFESQIPSMYCRQGWLADYAAEIKKITNLPVITVGRHNNPFTANAVLASGKADLVSMGRQSLCDPDTPNKAAEGRFEEIRTCIACHHGCVGALLRNDPIGCILNPTLGKEAEFAEIKKTEKPKKVLVVGAGPAGLEAAISAAKAGHDVEVFEKRRWAGGQLRLGSVPPAKGEMVNFINWQLNELKKLAVPVHFNSEVSLEKVKKLDPDVVIAATGAVPSIPPIPGIERENVVTAHDVLEGKANPSGKIVVIGGGCVGAETADHLASNLKDVTVVEMLPEVASDEIIVPRWALLDDLRKNNVKILTNTKVKKIGDLGVVVEHAGKEEVLPADFVVLAAGAKPETSLAEELKKEGIKTVIIGDASKPGLAGPAIMEGFLLGRNL